MVNDTRHAVLRRGCMTEIIYLKSLTRHQYHDEVKEKINVCVPYFPEIEYLYVGVSNQKRDHVACADVDNNIARFRVNVKPTFVTTFHELMHIVQWGNDRNPKTEEFCSIMAMARMPSDLVDEEDIPYIGRGRGRAKSEFADLCRCAVKYRESGRRDYIQYLKDIMAGYRRIDA